MGLSICLIEDEIGFYLADDMVIRHWVIDMGHGSGNIHAWILILNLSDHNDEGFNGTGKRVYGDGKPKDLLEVLA
jgi:hypothetical protein